MGGGGGSGALFRVGDTISLAHVLVFLSFLVLFVIVFEQLLHKLEHSAKRSRKHEEMVRKVYRELMILGFIGVAIKVYKEITHISAYSESIVALQIADLVMFILAVALIIQAICVFLALRRENFELDRAELLHTTDLATTIARRQRGDVAWPTWWPTHRARSGLSAANNSNSNAAAIRDRELHDLVQLRVLRHLFLRRYGLPELFPFSKYVRQAQDKQITHMIDVEISMWLLLLGVVWGLDGVISLLLGVDAFGSESSALLWVFLVFAWTLVALHVAVALYFGYCIKKLLVAGGYSSHGDSVACLAAIGADEAAALNGAMASDALEVMQEVQERQDARHRHAKARRQRQRHCLVEKDTGFQVLAMVWRHAAACFREREAAGLKPRDTRADSDTVSTITATPRTPATSRDWTDSGSVGDGGRSVSRRRSAVLPVEIRGFSRKAWQFSVTFLMMLNAFYLALLCHCVFYQLGSLAQHTAREGFVLAVGLPLPVLLNMAVLQPKILRNFMIVSSILRVDVDTLSKVVTHFSEIVELRAEFVHSLLACLRATGRTVADLELAFEARSCSRRHDEEGDGALELEQLRLVLRSFGFRLSHFRFNSVAKLLFRLRDTKVEYAQVLRMLALAEQDCPDSAPLHASAETGHSGHVLLRQSVFVEEDDDGSNAQQGRQEEATARWMPPTARARDGGQADELILVTSAGRTASAAPAARRVDAATAIMPRHSHLVRRQSSFQNTSVRALHALYHLETHASLLPATAELGDASSPSHTSVYVRM